MKALASIGSVSHATMRSDDLIPCFVELLSELNEKRSLSWKDHFSDELAATAEFSRLDSLLGGVEERMESEEYFDSEDSQWDLESLFDHLNEFAPAHCYFGAHPGDCSDYGFWPSEEFLQGYDDDGECLRVSDLSDVPDDYTGEVLEVNDHGNATLYFADNGKLSECWSIV